MDWIPGLGQCRSELWLSSSIAVAEFDETPSPGTPIGHRCAPKKKDAVVGRCYNWYIELVAMAVLCQISSWPSEGVLQTPCQPSYWLMNSSSLGIREGLSWMGDIL